MKAIAGKTWLWKNYANLIGSYLKLRGVPTHRINSEFSPSRLVWWAMDEVDDFNKSRPDQPKIRSHDFCKRAITEALKAGMDVDTVASGVGRNPNVVSLEFTSELVCVLVCLTEIGTFVLKMKSPDSLGI